MKSYRAFRETGPRPPKYLSWFTEKCLMNRDQSMLCETWTARILHSERCISWIIVNVWPFDLSKLADLVTRPPFAPFYYWSINLDQPLVFLVSSSLCSLPDPSASSLLSTLSPWWILRFLWSSKRNAALPGGMGMLKWKKNNRNFSCFC